MIDTFRIGIRSNKQTNSPIAFLNYRLISSGLYIHIISESLNFQEVWDTARRLSCTWRDSYSKQVNFAPLRVSMLDVVQTEFKGDEIKCWMDIRQGVYPNASTKGNRYDKERRKLLDRI